MAVGGNIATAEGIAEGVSGWIISSGCEETVQGIAIYLRGMGREYNHAAARVCIARWK